MKVIRLTIENRFVAILLTILIVALGVTLLTVGVALLAGLAITGVVVGTGAALYRRLRGKSDGAKSSTPTSAGSSTSARPTATAS